ncbi:MULTISPECIES: hypothetical protein [unclassified Bradyrhizobium]
MTTRQLTRACHVAAEIAEITKRVTPHTLRHSFASAVCTTPHANEKCCSRGKRERHVFVSLSKSASSACMTAAAAISLIAVQVAVFRNAAGAPAHSSLPLRVQSGMFAVKNALRRSC